MITNTGKLAGRTLFITGASRGIGKSIALKAARDGANIVIAAKTAEPHPKLPGTIFTAAEEIQKAGGNALPCLVDVRDENQVRNAIKQAVEKFGGIDILVNNASAISLTPTEQTDMKRYDLMHNVNTRGTFLVSKECIPYLKKSDHAHILNLSPPLNMAPYWFSNHLAYTMAKYGMSMCVLGMAKELREDNIAVNALWPRTIIQTAAVEMLLGSESDKFARKPEIVADAAYTILCQKPSEATGNFFVDEDVLTRAGLTDLKQYACHPENSDSLMPDGFLEGTANNVLDKHSTKPIDTKEGNIAQIPQLFESIAKSLNAEIVSKTSAIYQFNVLGAEKGVWFLDMKNGTGKCGQGEPTDKADATLTMDSVKFYDMFTVEKAGGKALPCIVDVRDEQQVKNAIKKAVDTFGGIDILVNNASAISLTPTEQTDMKRYDLMHNINTRGTFLVSKECIPYLKESKHAHILNISPPLNMSPHWFSNHVAYTMAKYGMSMCVLGMAKELREKNIAVNALWPRTAIHTAAMDMLAGSESAKFSRKPEIMADAAYALLCRDPSTTTGKFLIDDEVLREAGVNDLIQYACHAENSDKLMADFFLDEEPNSGQLHKDVEKPAVGKNASTPQIPKLFEKMKATLNEDIVVKVNAIYQFNVLGAEKGTWFLDLKNGEGKCGPGEPSMAPDATLTMDSVRFFDMFTGKLKPAAAFMSGKLKISGDLQKAMKLEKLLKTFKSKL